MGIIKLNTLGEKKLHLLLKMVNTILVLKLYQKFVCHPYTLRSSFFVSKLLKISFFILKLLKMFYLCP